MRGRHPTCASDCGIACCDGVPVIPSWEPLVVGGEETVQETRTRKTRRWQYIDGQWRLIEENVPYTVRTSSAAFTNVIPIGDVKPDVTGANAVKVRDSLSAALGRIGYTVRATDVRGDLVTVITGAKQFEEFYVYHEISARIESPANELNVTIRPHARTVRNGNVYRIELPDNSIARNEFEALRNALQ